MRTAGLLFLLSFWAFKTNAQQLDSARYWVDQDFANVVTVATPNMPNLDWTQLVNTSALTYGLHTLNVVFKDANGKWSIAQATHFYKQPQLISYQYWFDDDYSSAQNNAVSPAQDPVNFLSSLNTNSLTYGLHKLH